MPGIVQHAEESVREGDNKQTNNYITLGSEQCYEEKHNKLRS